MSDDDTEHEQLEAIVLAEIGEDWADYLWTKAQPGRADVAAVDFVRTLAPPLRDVVLASPTRALRAMWVIMQARWQRLDSQVPSASQQRWEEIEEQSERYDSIMSMIDAHADKVVRELEALARG